MIRQSLALMLVGCVAVSSAVAEKPKEFVAYDESKQGDLPQATPDSPPVLQINKPGIHVVQGIGTDAVDDVDTLVFEVEGDKPFKFALVGDAAEFKKLRVVEEDGTLRDVAFGSTNPVFRAHRNITADDLAPGRYHAELAFGPNGAMGEWFIKISAGGGETGPLFTKPVYKSTAEKQKHVDWPGAIAIYHGHNWGEDKGYLLAIKEAGFKGVGVAEWQIEEVADLGLRAFVFIWPHEAATIPPKYKDNKAVLCYYLSDRIPPHQWASWASNENVAYKGDPYHPAVFTMKGTWDGIDQFCPTVRGRVMEYYHYRWDGNRKPHMHYAILEQYRQASQANGFAPVCRIVETRPEDMRKTRQTVYSSLAYGVRGFRMGGALWDTNERDDRGVPAANQFGKEMSAINQAINAYSPVFKMARCMAVYHTAPIPAGCSEPPRDSDFQLDGSEVCVGIFRQPQGDDADKAVGNTESGFPSTEYLLVVNRDAFKERTAGLEFKDVTVKVRRMDKSTGNWIDEEAATSAGISVVNVKLEPGSGELYEVVRTKP